MKHTGVSMGGSIEYTRKAKPIPCDCNKCFYKRRNKMGKYNYCGYYEITFPTNKKKCARYSGKPINKKVIKQEIKSCKNCLHYDSKFNRCNKFKFEIKTYGLGSKCKAYDKSK